MNNSITCLKGVKVGHASNSESLQGVTVILFDAPYPVAYKSNGGTGRVYDADIMHDGKSYPAKHAIYISDGAHQGLETAAFIAKALREKGIGWHLGKSIIPSLTGAAVQSLGLNLAPFQPELGVEAVNSLSNDEVIRGNVGAGTGTSVGKFSWVDGKIPAMKSGVGCTRIDLSNGVTVSALTVVNALGNVINPDGSVLAGNRNDKETPKYRSFMGMGKFLTDTTSNTTISVVGTNAKITTNEDLRRIAEIATQGQVRAINPVNTSIDGDTVFVFTTGEVEMKMNGIGEDIAKSDWYKIGIDVLAQTAAQAVQDSIYDACKQAVSIDYPQAYKGIVPSYKDY